MVVVVVAAEAAPVHAKRPAGDGAGRAESTVDGAFGRMSVEDTKSGRAVKCCVASMTSTALPVPLPARPGGVFRQ